MNPPMNPAGTDPRSRKAMLFCPACGRGIPFPEGWVHAEGPSPETVECPDCNQVVVAAEADRRATLTAVWTTYARAVSDWWVTGKGEVT